MYGLHCSAIPPFSYFFFSAQASVELRPQSLDLLMLKGIDKKSLEFLWSEVKVELQSTVEEEQGHRERAFPGNGAFQS